MNITRTMLAALALLAPSAVLASPSKTPTKPAMSNSKAVTQVNINSANAMQLEKLPGVGPKLAAEIIKNRPYKNGAEVQAKVKIIGPKFWAILEKHVLFK